MRVIFRSTNHPLDEPRTDPFRVEIAGIQDVALWRSNESEHLVLTFNKRSDAYAAYERLGGLEPQHCSGAPYGVVLTATRWGTYMIEGRHYNVVEVTRRRR